MALRGGRLFLFGLLLLQRHILLVLGVCVHLCRYVGVSLTLPPCSRSIFGAHFSRAKKPSPLPLSKRVPEACHLQVGVCTSTSSLHGGFAHDGSGLVSHEFIDQYSLISKLLQSRTSVCFYIYTEQYIFKSKYLQSQLCVKVKYMGVIY